MILGSISATEDKGAPPTKSDPSIISIQKAENPPKIDGKLDDPIWQNSAVVSNFNQFIVNEGEPTTEPTEVRITYDNDNIYFGIRCYDRDPANIIANLSKRDDLQNDDWISISLDPFASGKRGMDFIINPYGIQMDALKDENNLQDFTWDAVFQSRGAVDGSGWTAEIAIPFKSLNLPDKPAQEWSLLINRYISRKNEMSTWPPLSRQITSYMQQSGKIKGILIEPQHPFELTPYVSGGYQSQLNADNNNLEGAWHHDVGGDLKYGLSSDVIANLTINPDFNQIEADADQVEINNRYELYFPEKRPFFLESLDKFKTPIEVFYSRRIANPMAGAKLTGKKESYNFGILSTWDEGYTENPAALYNVVRVSKDIGDQSGVGLIMTDKENKGKLKDHLYNRLLGLDSRFHFLDYYTLTLQGLYSWTSQMKEDKKINVSDPALTATFSRNDGNLKADLIYTDIAPDFVADSGYIQRTDLRTVEGDAYYNFRPETWLRIFTPFTTQQIYYNYAGELTDRQHQLGFNFDFASKTYLQLAYIREMEAWENNDYSKNALGLYLKNNLSDLISGKIRFKMGDAILYNQKKFPSAYSSDEAPLGFKYSLFLQANINPTKSLSMNFETTWESFRKKIKGKEIYDIWLLREKINYQISSDFFIRAIAEQNTFDKTLGFNGLIGYEPTVGVVAYLGYKEDLTYENKFSTIGRTLFAKLAYHWQDQ